MEETSLHLVHAAAEQETEIILIYISNILRGKTKSPPSIKWGLLLPKISPSPRRTTVFEFKHGIASKAPFEQLLDRGRSLFPEVFDPKCILPGVEGKCVSYYFLCQQLGGLILKTAFARAIETPAWKPYLRSIRGLFLIGVPHVSDVEDRNKLCTVLQLKSHRLRETALPEKVASQLFLEAKQFAYSASELAPTMFIVSAYCEAPAKGGFITQVFTRSDESIPQADVYIGLAKQETLLSIDPDFKAIWDAQSTLPFQNAVLSRLENDMKVTVVTGVRPLTDNNNPESSSTSSSPVPPSRRSSPSSTASGQQNSIGSFVHLTPPISSTGYSRSSNASTRYLEPARANVSLPCLFPETALDRAKYFIGRQQELVNISDVLLPTTERNTCFDSLHSYAISGLGGVGKTELALQYANKHRERYDLTMIIKADQPARLIHQFNKLAKMLGLVDETEKPSSDECREALKSWFKKPYGARSPDPMSRLSSDSSQIGLLKWLLVFDNVKDWATLDPFWPDKGCGSVLITSRRPHILPQLELSGNTGILGLGDLPIAEASKLLQHYAGTDHGNSPDVEEVACTIAAKMEGLPLAILQAGSYINQCKMTIPKFLEAHPKESDLDNLYLEEGYEHNLFARWTLESLAHESDASREAFAVLCVVAFLDPESIQDDLLRPDVASNQIPDYPSNGTDFHHRIKLLIGTSLLDRGGDGVNITVHRMVQKVVRTKIARDNGLSEQVFRHVLTRLMLLWPYTNRTYTIGTQGMLNRWPRCTELLPHVSALSEGYFSLRDRGRLSRPDLDLADLLNEASAYHCEKEELKEASRLLDLRDVICESAKDTIGETQYRLRICRGRLGIAHVTRDKTEYFRIAEMKYKLELERFTQSGALSTDWAAANHQMGIAHNLNSLYKEAKFFLMESAKIRSSLPGFKKDWLFTPYYHLAHSYYHLGDNKKAQELLETAINDRVEALGENDRVSMRTGALYYTLGDVKLQQGKLEESFGLHWNAWNHLKSTNGPNSLGALHCQYKVASHMARMGDVEAAKSHLKNVLNHYRIEPHARPYISRAAFLCAQCLKGGKIDPKEKGPIDLLEEAVQIFNEFSSFPRTAQTLTEEDALSLVAYDYL